MFIMITPPFDRMTSTEIYLILGLVQGQFLSNIFFIFALLSLQLHIVFCCVFAQFEGNNKFQYNSLPTKRSKLSKSPKREVVRYDSLVSVQ